MYCDSPSSIDVTVADSPDGIVGGVGGGVVCGVDGSVGGAGVLELPQPVPSVTTIIPAAVTAENRIQELSSD